MSTCLFFRDCNADKADVNESAELALCRRCGNFFKAEMKVARGALKGPKGAWFREDGEGFEVGCSARRWTGYGYALVALLWTCPSLGVVYGIPISNGKFSVVVFLMGLPFLVVGLGLLAAAIFRLWGTVSVRCVNGRATVRSGVGGIGWRRRFCWDEVVEVREGMTAESRVFAEVDLESGRRIVFARGIESEQMEFLLRGLRRMRKLNKNKMMD